MRRYLINIRESVSTMLIGLGITGKHLLRAKNGNVTLQYPEEKWPRPERNIGFDHQDYNVIRSQLVVDINDCTGCKKCERACPVGCISVETLKVPKGTDLGATSNDTIKRLLVTRHDIDLSECMFCNLCTFPCPEECIYMTGGPNSHKTPLDYEFSEYDRNNLIYKFAIATQDEIDGYTNPVPATPASEGVKV